jgi:hypothetical protein
MVKKKLSTNAFKLHGYLKWNLIVQKTSIDVMTEELKRIDKKKYTHKWLFEKVWSKIKETNDEYKKEVSF